jgi:hypothetical protein
MFKLTKSGAGILPARHTGVKDARPTGLLIFALLSGILPADQALMEEHCGKCHNDDKAKGKFTLTELGDKPSGDNIRRWLDCLDLVKAEEMPPEDEEAQPSAVDRKKIIDFLGGKLRTLEEESRLPSRAKPRRLNNREFSNSVRDVLMIEDIGTNLPMDNLIGDSLHHGFDTHADTLGFSRFHLEQYIEAARKVVDATILSGERPEMRRYEIDVEGFRRGSYSQNLKKEIEHSKNGVFDLLDMRAGVYLAGFETVPHTGRYKIKIRCTGKDRLVYNSKYTGIYEGDPIQLSVRLGDRKCTFDLPDEEPFEIEMDEWISAGSRLTMHNPTDGLSMNGNGNFKFQYRIVSDHYQENDPKRYKELVKEIEASAKKSRKGIGHWSNWVNYWEGPRPRLFSAEIEGPIFDSWPPKRQVALVGEDPKIANAKEILTPIAERAWRRPVRDGALDDIVALVEAKGKTLSHIEAIKEGIVAILVSPAFLLLNSEGSEAPERFASKFSYFLRSAPPTQELHTAVNEGQLKTYAAVLAKVKSEFDQSKADEFLKVFPYAWLELGDINFMAPDPDFFRFYHRKRVSEDMVNEVLEFFRHAVANNISIPEFLSADYSYINADLAVIYGADDVAHDSRFRKYAFTDGRRGGLLGMAAFLTSTADSLGTSPIHRAVYVMENLMGIQPVPPPPNVVITEPDVRQAKTIKELLAAHTKDSTCASCHKSIDPWGYAFENFDPTGAWRDVYSVLNTDGDKKKTKTKAKAVALPIDASAKFRSGASYKDITEFRKIVLSDSNLDRFVRCFITKLLTYANGENPADADYIEIDKILQKSAEKNYRIVETIAAVINSKLFREE